MPGLLLTGVNSQIVKCLREILPSHIAPIELGRATCDMASIAAVDRETNIIERCDYFVLAHGVLSRKPFLMRHETELCQSLVVNMLSVVRICEIALERNANARIVVMGSDSARNGSHDVAYGLAKAGLHAYVQSRAVGENQQLVAIAPSMIGNTGMTRQKTEAELSTYVQAHPKKRPVGPLEVARLIHFLLFTDMGYISNTVVEMNGGKFARRSP